MPSHYYMVIFSKLTFGIQLLLVKPKNRYYLVIFQSEGEERWRVGGEWAEREGLREREGVQLGSKKKKD